MSFVKDINIGMKRKLTAEEKRKSTDSINKAYIADSKLVKGTFKNIECPGASLEFSLRLYKQDPIRVYNFEDGESYTIPMGVAKHINRQCQYKRSKHLVDKEGNPIIGYNNPISRYQFVSEDYM